MGNILSQLEGPGGEAPVRCPICAQDNTSLRHCRHVRWTFERGGPLEFALYALNASPYTQGRGHRSGEIPRLWWDAHAGWIVEQVELRFHAADGFVFGELADLDRLARDIWTAYRPDPVRAGPQRT